MSCKKFLCIVISCVLVLFGAASSGYAASWYVTNDGGSLKYYRDSSNTYSQSKWSSVTSNAGSFTIEDLFNIDTNTALSADDNFYFKAGTYKMNSGIKIDTSVNIYGGFSGNASAAVSRDIANNETIFDGDSGLSLYRVFYITTDATIDGLTIQNGLATYTNYAYNGGGVQIVGDGSTNVTIANCTLKGNSAAQGRGGAIYAGNTNITITNSTITNNSSNYAGGIFITGTSTTAKIDGCTITGNSAQTDDGSIYFGESVAPTITNSTITNNTGSGGGGIHTASSATHVISSSDISNNASDGFYFQNTSATAVITNCTILSNQGNGVNFSNGSTIRITGSDIKNNSSNGIYTRYGVSRAIIENSNITGNSNEGIYVNNSSTITTVTDCVITGNSQTGITSSGTLRMTSCDISNNLSYGISNSGSATVTECLISNNGSTGVYNTNTIEIASCDIKNNTGLYAGGIFTRGDSLKVTNSKITNNSSSSYYGYDSYYWGYEGAGGIFSIYDDVTITNCNITGNASTFSTNNDSDRAGGVAIFLADTNVFSATNCNIINNTSYSHGGGIVIGARGSSKATIENCNISGNSTAGGNGGGIHSHTRDTAITTISGCNIANNTVEGTSNVGSGYWLIARDNATTKVENCTITGNVSTNNDNSNAVYVIDNSTTAKTSIINCDIVSNDVKTQGYELYVADSDANKNSLTVANNLIWNESADRLLYGLTTSDLTDCAITENALDGYTGVTVASTWKPVKSSVTIDGVNHTVYLLEKNSALSGLSKKITKTSTMSNTDQIGNTRNSTTSIGSVENASSLGVAVSGAEKVELGVNESTTFTASAGVDYGVYREALTADDYSLTWSMTPVIAGVSIDQTGKLSVSSSASTGDYSITIRADAQSSTLSGYGTKAVALTVDKGLPVLSADKTSVTVKKGESVNFKITATKGKNITSRDITPASSWLNLSGEASTGVYTLSGTVPYNASKGSTTYTITAMNAAGTGDTKVTVNISGSSFKSDELSSDGNQTTGTRTITNPTTNKTRTQTIYHGTTNGTNTDTNYAALVSVDIETASKDYTGIVSVPFSEKVSVDAVVKINVADYTNYSYSMDVEGLPDGLYISGDIKTTKTITDGQATYNHAFAIAGTPTASVDETAVTLTANITITGDTPEIYSYAAHVVSISIQPVTMISLDAKIDDAVLSLDLGETKSLTLSTTVTGLSNLGTTSKIGAGEYSSTWSTKSADLLNYGMSITEDGVLSVYPSADVGTYYVPVHVVVSRDSINTSADNTVTVTVNNVKPELSVSESSVNVKKGESVSITISVDKGKNITSCDFSPVASWLKLSAVTDGEVYKLAGTVPYTLANDTYTYTVKAENEKGSGTASVAIIVNGSGFATTELSTDGTTTIGSRDISNPTANKTRARTIYHGANDDITSDEDYAALVSVDIETTSNDLSGIVSVPFSETVSVDTEFEINVADYDTYSYSMDVEGLPDGLYISGDILTTKSLEDSDGTYNHVFTIAGTPTTSVDETAVTLTATITITGDTPIIYSYAAHVVSISIQPVGIKSLDVVISDDVLSVDTGTGGSLTLNTTATALTNVDTIIPIDSSEYSSTWSTASTDLTNYGMSLSESGVLTVETSAAVGTYYVPVHVVVTHDEVTASADNKITVTVNNVKPEISASSNSVALKKGESTTITITVDKGENITNCEISPSSSWLSLNAGTNGVYTLSGTVPYSLANGSTEYTITATNEVGTGSTAITFTVNGSGFATNELSTDGSTTNGKRTVSNPTTTKSRAHTIYHGVNDDTTSDTDYAALVDVDIETASTDLAGIVNVPFSELVSVDTVITINVADYDTYSYSMDVEGLPDGFKISGDIKTTETFTDGTATYNHVFTIAGTPTKSFAATAVTLTANITITGDTPTIYSYASHVVSISIQPVTIKSLDVIVDDGTLDVNSSTGGSLTLNATVTGLNILGETLELGDSEYSATWNTASNDLSDYGISFSESGVLSVNTSAVAGTYYVPVSVTVTKDSITASANATVTITITSGGGGDIVENLVINSLSDYLANATDEEIAAVQMLRIVGDANLTNLNDVARFTGLTSLEFEDCENLVSGDLSGNTLITEVVIQNCTSLTTFNAYNTNIKTLDLSGCSNLVTVDCSAGDITTLILDGCTALTKLVCTDNSLTELNLAECPNIEELSCTSNRISLIVLPANTVIKILLCDFNALGTLDLGGISTLEEVAFRGQTHSITWSSSRSIDLTVFTNNSGIADYDTQIADASKILKVQGYKNNNLITTTYTAGSNSATFATKPDKVIYYYDVGLEGENGENLSMDVTIATSGSTGGEIQPATGPGSSSGGCNGGFSSIALFGLLLTSFAIKKKH